MFSNYSQIMAIEDKEIILLKVSGHDKPVTAGLTVY
jgi:hypothetical protein